MNIWDVVIVEEKQTEAGMTPAVARGGRAGEEQVTGGDKGELEA